MGFLVVPHGDYIGVRLSLMTSVRVGIAADGHLTCQPYFGVLDRTHATVVKTLGFTMLAFAALVHQVALPIEMGVAFLALSLWGFDGLRYTLTESCVSQVRHAYLAQLDADRADSVLGVASTKGALNAPMPSPRWAAEPGSVERSAVVRARSDAD